MPSEDQKRELSESLAFPIDLLKGQMLRLALKEEPFQTFNPATETEIDDLWKNYLELDDKLQVWNVVCLSDEQGSYQYIILNLEVLCISGFRFKFTRFISA